MQAAESSFDGVSFHCYAGTFDEMAKFTSAYPNKEIWHTECTGQFGTDWWSNIKVRNLHSAPFEQVYLFLRIPSPCTPFGITSVSQADRSSAAFLV